jgi:hypothetical protein
MAFHIFLNFVFNCDGIWNFFKNTNISCVRLSSLSVWLRVGKIGFTYYFLNFWVLAFRAWTWVTLPAIFAFHFLFQAYLRPWSSSIYASSAAGITGVLYHAQLVFWDSVSLSSCQSWSWTTIVPISAAE